tara:strand:+ start:55 stop:567 length:513 start_codon:yes stop_codon:yes gene_type:complete
MSQTLASFAGNRNEDFQTPRSFMKWLEEERGLVFDLDAAASSTNAVAPEYFTKEDDALNQDWFGRVWLNPPYGRQITKWIDKCGEQIQRPEVDSIWVLIPARVDTIWFHDKVMKSAYNVYLIKGRFNFTHRTSLSGKNAPFPAMLVCYRKHRLPGSGITTMTVPSSARSD